MKRFLLLTLVLLASSAVMFAQHKGGKHKEDMFKEIKEFKLRYLAQELELPEDECQEFFVLYSQEMDERHKVWDPVMSLQRKAREGKATDEEYEQLSEAMNAAKSADAEIEARYDARYKKILTPKQIYKLKEAEETFREKMREMKSKNPRHHKK